MDIRITDEMNPRRAAQVADVLRRPRLWVPTEKDYGSAAHEAWVAKSEAEIAEGNRRALLARIGGVSVGVTVFRQDPGDASVVGLRNVSILPEAQGRRLGSFMLRNTEFAALEEYPRAVRMRVDTKTSNVDMIAFLLSQSYLPIGTEDLYGSGRLDVVFEKRLAQT